MLYLPYGKIISKNTFPFCPPLLSFFILSPLFHISFIHPISIPPVPFSPFLSFHHIHSTCVQLSLSPHTCSTFCTFFPLLPSNNCFPSFSFPHLHLAIIFLSCALSLPRYYGISSVVHLSYSLLYLDSSILSLLSCLSVSLCLSPSSTLTHLPFALNLSTSSLAYPFLW
jgi:hypothetical protein